jgi:hypothetical protein
MFRGIAILIPILVKWSRSDSSSGLGERIKIILQSIVLPSSSNFSEISEWVIVKKVVRYSAVQRRSCKLH